MTGQAGPAPDGLATDPLLPVSAPGLAGPAGGYRQRARRLLSTRAGYLRLAPLLLLAPLSPLAVPIYLLARLDKWMTLVVIGPALAAMVYLILGAPSDPAAGPNPILAVFPLLQSAAICLDITLSLLAGLALYVHHCLIHRRPLLRHALACLTVALAFSANYPLHGYARLLEDQNVATMSTLSAMTDRITSLNRLEASPATREALRLTLLGANYAIGVTPPIAQQSKSAFQLLMISRAACAEAVPAPANAACLLAKRLSEPAPPATISKWKALLVMLDPRRAVLRRTGITPAEQLLPRPQPPRPPGGIA